MKPIAFLNATPYSTTLPIHGLSGAWGVDLHDGNTTVCRNLYTCFDVT